MEIHFHDSTFFRELDEMISFDIRKFFFFDLFVNEVYRLNHRPTLIHFRRIS